MIPPMSVDASVNDATESLEGCTAVPARLDAMCCEAGRSPRPAALADTLTEAQSEVAAADEGGAPADAVLEQPEVTGGQVGRLQVGCCAPGRLPLRADLLKGLTKAQLARNAAVEQGHARR